MPVSPVKKSILLIALLFSFRLHSQFASDAFHVKLRITDVGNGYFDETVVSLRQGATTSFDNSFDAFKFFSPSFEVPSLYTLSADQYALSINSLPHNQQNWLVPLFISTNHYSEFKFEIQLQDHEISAHHLFLVLPDEGCYLEWDFEYFLIFQAGPLKAEQAYFFLLLEYKDNKTIEKRRCILPEHMELSLYN